MVAGVPELNASPRAWEVCPVKLHRLSSPAEYVPLTYDEMISASPAALSGPMERGQTDGSL